MPQSHHFLPHIYAFLIFSQLWLSVSNGWCNDSLAAICCCWSEHSSTVIEAVVSLISDNQLTTAYFTATVDSNMINHFHWLPVPLVIWSTPPRVGLMNHVSVSIRPSACSRKVFLIWTKLLSSVTRRCAVWPDARSRSQRFEMCKPSNTIWPHLSYGLVRSKREYCHNCSLVMVLCSFLYSCTVIWAAHRFCLPNLASSHWVHSLCLGYFVCVRLFSCIISACMLYYCNMVRW